MLSNIRVVPKGMRVWWLLCCLVVFLFGSGRVWGASSKKASLALATDPAHSSFRIVDAKGKVVAKGNTPFVGMLPTGQYRLSLSKNGFFVEQRTLFMLAGQQKILRIVLMKKAGGTTGSSKKKTSKQPNRKQPDKRTKPTPKKKLLLPSQKATRPNDIRIQPPVRTSQSAKKQAKKAQDSPKASKRKIPWIPIVLAGGLVIAGGVFWGLSSASFSASRDRNKFQKEAFQEYQQARSHRSTSTFLFAMGGAAVVLGALFYFWEPSQNKNKPRQMVPSTVVGSSATDFSVSFTE